MKFTTIISLLALSLGIACTVLFQNCKQNQSKNKESSESPGNPELEDTGLPNPETTDASTNNHTKRAGIFRDAKLSPQGLTKIETFGDPSVYVRNQDEILITGSGRSGLSIYRVVRSKIEDNPKPYWTFKLRDFGYCYIGAAEIFKMNGEEILIFQGAKTETTECPEAFSLVWFNARTSLYMINFGTTGINKREPPREQDIVPIQTYLEKTLDPNPKIDGSVYCESDYCYFSYVYFDGGNEIAVVKFKPGKSGENTRAETPLKVKGLVKRESITEGPSIRKIKGRYYLFYSTGNVWGTYGLNYRFADSIDKLINSQVHQNGTTNLIKEGSILNPVYKDASRSSLAYTQGHGDVFSLDGNNYYLVHHIYDQNPDHKRDTLFTQLRILSSGFIEPFVDDLEKTFTPKRQTPRDSPLKIDIGFINPNFIYSMDLEILGNSGNIEIIRQCLNAESMQNQNFLGLMEISNGRYFTCPSADNQSYSADVVKTVRLLRLPKGLSTLNNWSSAQMRRYPTEDGQINIEFE